jgi:undecaprenyl-diphosphatase
MDFLYGIDVALFHFFNQTLSCAVGNILWPLVTDYDKWLVVRIPLVGLWLWLLIKGGVRGRTVALMVIVVIVCSDQLSSSVIKSIVQRPRPCHIINGATIVPDINLLVGCGGGKSFPSSHAVNNFAVATLFAWYYRRGKYWLYAWASLIAISRVFVGVHYPSDVVGGALIGTGVALAILATWSYMSRRWFPSLAVNTTGGGTP